jgi:ribosomal protein L40E
MIILATVLLVVATFAAVAYPFLRRQEVSTSLGASQNFKELHFKRDHTYAMIKELEFDFQSGTLSEEDYKKLGARYQSKAISILKEIDGLQEEKPLQDEIEASIEKQVSRLRQSKGNFCPQCGAKRPPEARFCTECGTRL